MGRSLTELLRFRRAGPLWMLAESCAADNRRDADDAAEGRSGELSGGWKAGNRSPPVPAATEQARRRSPLASPAFGNMRRRPLPRVSIKDGTVRWSRGVWQTIGPGSIA